MYSKCKVCGEADHSKGQTHSFEDDDVRIQKFDVALNRVFMAVMAKLSDDAPPYQGNNADWWNAEVAPHLREMRTLFDLGDTNTPQGN